MDGKLQSFAVPPGEGEAMWSLGCLTFFRATAAQTGGAFALIDEVGPKSDGTPLHRHSDDDESFYVLEGELVFHLSDGEPISATVGTFVHIPKGQVHAFRVESPTARYLILTTPQHEQFYRAIGEPAKERSLPPESTMDMDMIMAAAERFNVEIVGPPPSAST